MHKPADAVEHGLGALRVGACQGVFAQILVFVGHDEQNTVVIVGGERRCHLARVDLVERRFGFGQKACGGVDVCSVEVHFVDPFAAAGQPGDRCRDVDIMERGVGVVGAVFVDEIAADPETLLGIGGLRQPAPQRTDAALFFGCVGSRFPQARVEAVEQLLSRQAAVERRGAFCRRAADRYD